MPGTGDHEPRYSFRFKISEHARRVFLQNSLPVPHQAVRAIDGRNDLAPLLPTFLGTVMANKTAWDRYTDELLRDDLRYTRNPGTLATQRRTMARALRYINGAIIPSGTLAAEVRQSTDHTRNVLHDEAAGGRLVEDAAVIAAGVFGELHRPVGDFQTLVFGRPALPRLAIAPAMVVSFGGGHELKRLLKGRLADVTGDEQALFTAIATTKDLDLSGHLKTTRRQCLTHELLREGDRLGVPLKRPHQLAAVRAEDPTPSAGARPQEMAPGSVSSTWRAPLPRETT